jgi:hypothetical protein
VDHRVTTVPPDSKCSDRFDMEDKMNALGVKLLQRATSYPSVSLLMPINGDSAEQVDLRLRHLVDEAVDRLRHELDPDDVNEFAARLSTCVDGIELVHGQLGVAVYVSDRTTVVPLSVRVRERVVVDETFATRDLVRALQRSTRYWVLALGPKVTRLFEGVGFDLTEVRGGAFPLTVGRSRSGSDQRFAGRGRVSRANRRDGTGVANADTSVRAIDDALSGHLHDDRFPLVLVGTEPRLAAMTRTSQHRERIVGTVRGATDFPKVEDLSSRVWPAVERMLHEETARAIDELERAGGAARHISGVTETWTLANQGRGDLLLVEESFEYPAYVDPNNGQVTGTDDRDRPGVIDDLVDEIIEVVLARGGRCHIVPDGSLAGYDRIAMKLRY